MMSNTKKRNPDADGHGAPDAAFLGGEEQGIR
jgi:hypothetical protein